MVYIAFYSSKNGTILDHLIAWISHGPFSHVELQLGDDLYFSSSLTFNGTAFKTLEQLTAKKYLPENWVRIPVIMTAEDEEKIMKFCESEDNCRYDWRGVLGFVFPFLKPSKNRWWCSEVVEAALQQIGVCKDMDNYHSSPNSLYKYVTNEKN